MVDTYSEYLLTHPRVKHPAIQGMESLIGRYGVLAQVQSDNGSHFSGAAVQDWANEWGIQWVFHIPHHPQMAGLTERMNGLLKQKIKQLMPDHTLKRWSTEIDQAEFELNSRPIGGGQTPLQRMVGLNIPTLVSCLKVWKTHLAHTCHS